jgi:transcriptional regulator with XRE-family HTH domain
MKTLIEKTTAENRLGERIVELLKKVGLTQKQLAERIGVTEAAMSRYIKGEREPMSNVVADMATALKTTADYLLGRGDFLGEEFNRVKVFVARNSATLTFQQKQELIAALLGSVEERGT